MDRRSDGLCQNNSENIKRKWTDRQTNEQIDKKKALKKSFVPFLYFNRQIDKKKILKKLFVPEQPTLWLGLLSNERGWGGGYFSPPPLPPFISACSEDGIGQALIFFNSFLFIMDKDNDKKSFKWIARSLPTYSAVGAASQ